MKLITTHYRKWLPWLLVITALYLAYSILNSSEVKRSKRGNQTKKVRVVKVAPLIYSTVEPTWLASGVVIPSEEVNVLSEVSGIIESINPLARPGALLAKDDFLLTIEQTDYLLNLAAAEAQLVQAQADFDLEAAERRLAKEELSYMDNVDESSLEMTLVLREPQFKTAQAKLAIAKVNVEKAHVALARTKAAMPFRGKLISKNVGLGSKVGQNSSLFNIVNVDAFWVEVKVPRSFLNILNEQAPVTLSQEKLWGKNKSRQARIIAVLPSLDSSDRQAKVLLEVEDPLNIANSNRSVKHPEIFINDFVNAELKGLPIENAITIKSHWLQADNSLWVVDKNNTLQKRFVTILFKGRDLIYVSGNFQHGDKALDEKPGIAAADVQVKIKQDNANGDGNNEEARLNRKSLNNSEELADKPKRDGAPKERNKPENTVQTKENKSALKNSGVKS